jgi:hypothetical protein
MTTRISRRTVLRAAAASAATLAMTPYVRGTHATNAIRIGVIGGESSALLRRLARRDDVALGDAADADAVVVATPPARRAAAAIDAMRAGKFVGVIAPVSATIDDCYRLVRAQRETHGRFMPLDPAIYDGPAVLVQTLADRGLFGEVTYAAAGYAAVAAACRWMGNNRPIALVATADITLIRTRKHWLIELRHGGSQSLQGMHGAYESLPDGRRMVHVQSRTRGESWEALENYGTPAARDPDDAMLDAFVNAARTGVSPISVVEAVTWAAVGPLRDRSLAAGPKQVAFPNFADA